MGNMNIPSGENTMPTKNDDTEQIISTLNTVRTWDQLYTLLKDLPVSVLSNVAQRMDTLLEQTQDDLLTARYERYLRLLQDCCGNGVQTAMDSFKMSLALTKEEAEAAINKLSENYEDIGDTTKTFILAPTEYRITSQRMKDIQGLKSARLLLEQKQDILLCGAVE